MKRSIILQYHSNILEGDHKNIILDITSVTGKVEIIDSYYFAIDNSFMPEDQSDEKVVKNLVINLEFWKKSILNIKDNESVFWPIDLSDEYIGFIIASCIDENTAIMLKYAITTEICGWGINASKPYEFVLNQEPYNVFAGYLIVSKEKLLNDINFSIINLNKLIEIPPIPPQKKQRL